MKQIIKNGRYNVVTCSTCQCEYAFDKTDIEADGTIICPQCGAVNQPPVKN